MNISEAQMKLYPFSEVAANAERQMAAGATIYQQWNCAHCGVKQTMSDKNTFYTHGRCEECKKETDIEHNGCNFMAVSSTDNPGDWIRDFLIGDKNPKKNPEKK